MSLIPEHLSAAAQTQLATQLAVIHAVSTTAFEGMEKLIALNFDTARQSLENAAATTRQWMSAKDPQELLSMSATQSQPQLEKILNYTRELAEITSHARNELMQAVGAADHLPLPAIFQISAVELTTKEVAKKETAKAAPAVLVTPEPKKIAAPAKPAKTVKVTAPVKSRTTATAATKSKPVEKAAAKASSEQQFPLLAEVAPKAPAKTVAPTVKTAKPASAEIVAEVKAAPIQAEATESAVKAKPAVAEKSDATATPTSKAAAVSTATSETVSNVPVVPPAKAVAHQTEAKAPATAAKKTAVKFPFPPSPQLKDGKASFPKADAKPAYKAKSSAATGAKKPVRQ
ncbi:MAG: TIGR01841 family phasin [Burkholderiales bacterium]|nr:TIGR01841 family phasin [Burkholderiales bacterium]